MKCLSYLKKKKTSVATFSENLEINKKVYFIINKKKLFKEKNSKKKANISGNIYINSVKNLNKYKKFVNKETVPFITYDKKEIIDIDNLSQFNAAKKWSKN